jgi:hypothetical protein
MVDWGAQMITRQAQSGCQARSGLSIGKKFKSLGQWNRRVGSSSAGLENRSGAKDRACADNQSINSA